MEVVSPPTPSADTCLLAGWVGQGSHPVCCLRCGGNVVPSPTCILLCLLCVQTTQTSLLQASPKGGGSLHRLQEVLQPPDWVLAYATPLSGLGYGVSTPLSLWLPIVRQDGWDVSSHLLLLVEGNLLLCYFAAGRFVLPFPLFCYLLVQVTMLLDTATMAESWRGGSLR